MIDITHLHIHWTDFKGKKHVKVITPTDATNTLMLKKDVAEYIQKFKPKIEYYYVVVEIDRDSKPAYRTIIPKTFTSQ
jgi:hypothetical protein